MPAPPARTTAAGDKPERSRCEALTARLYSSCHGRTRPYRGRRIARQLIDAARHGLREARIAAGLSQAAVAGAASAGQTKISRTDSGRLARLDVDDVARHAAVLGLRPERRGFPAGEAVRDPPAASSSRDFRPSQPGFGGAARCSSARPADYGRGHVVLDGPGAGDRRRRDWSLASPGRQRSMPSKWRDSRVAPGRPGHARRATTRLLREHRRRALIRARGPSRALDGPPERNGIALIDCGRARPAGRQAPCRPALRRRG